MSHHQSRPVTRRDALCRIGNGFGMLAFASLVGESLSAAGLTLLIAPDLQRIGPQWGVRLQG